MRRMRGRMDGGRSVNGEEREEEMRRREVKEWLFLLFLLLLKLDSD
jgi:hypothetical protein